MRFAAHHAADLSRGPQRSAEQKRLQRAVSTAASIRNRFGSSSGLSRCGRPLRDRSGCRKEARQRAVALNSLAFAHPRVYGCCGALSPLQARKWEACHGGRCGGFPERRAHSMRFSFDALCAFRAVTVPRELGRRRRLRLCACNPFRNGKRSLVAAAASREESCVYQSIHGRARATGSARGSTSTARGRSSLPMAVAHMPHIRWKPSFV